MSCPCSASTSASSSACPCVPPASRHSAQRSVVGRLQNSNVRPSRTLISITRFKFKGFKHASSAHPRAPQKGNSRRRREAGGAVEFWTARGIVQRSERNKHLHKHNLGDVWSDFLDRHCLPGARNAPAAVPEAAPEAPPGRPAPLRELRADRRQCMLMQSLLLRHQFLETLLALDGSHVRTLPWAAPPGAVGVPRRRRRRKRRRESESERKGRSRQGNRASQTRGQPATGGQRLGMRV
ncbi:unnamed protein product [Prorocentrum cordatum]|uniref:Uncharacterized protein n=1 Tax=Prorocentrum cordatum TaxID=2364126 RepID=A0ABN9XH18_9DINO|nr:unnamed protein product [Polarella glacialis]